MSRTPAQQRGQAAEDRALGFLQQQGLKLLARNFLVRGGELDLVMLEREELVFVEVRARKSAQFGDALASITASKRARVVLAAQHYLQQHPAHARRSCRFDVVGLTGNEAPVWLRQAFLPGE